MVIDFRTRPPYKSFVTGGNFFPRPMEDDFKNPWDVPPIYRDSVDIESARTGDFLLYMKELERSGIALQVVHGRRVRVDMCRVENDDVCSLEIENPGKFISFPAVDTADVSAAIIEIDRCFELYHMKGIALEPGWSIPPKYVDDRSLDPIYEKCEELGLICSFTLSILAGENLTYCNPLNLQKLALRFPRVIFTVSHGCWPFVEEFLGTALQCMNIYFYPDFFCNMPNMPFGDQFVRAANSYMRYRMMFATSYPVRPLGQSLEYFKKLAFEPEVMDLLLYKNAQRLLGRIKK
ncbi:MAG: amidohydrolase family protein [Hungatella sp.]